MTRNENDKYNDNDNDKYNDKHIKGDLHSSGEGREVIEVSIIVRPVSKIL